MQNRKLGGAVFILAGGFLGREFFSWAYGKVLDVASERIAGMRAATFPWMDAVGLLLLVVGAVLLFGRQKKVEPKEKAAPEPLPDFTPGSGGVFTPTVTVDNLNAAMVLTQVSLERVALEERSTLRIALVCFNGSGRQLTLRSFKGDAFVRPWPADGHALAPLPRGHLLFEPDAPLVAPPFGQWFMFLEWQLTQDVARGLLEQVAGRGFELDVEALRIMFCPEDDLTTETRFPLWPHIRIGTNPTYMGGWRINRAFLNIDL